MKTEVDENLSRRSVLLEKAFGILATTENEEEGALLQKDNFDRLMAAHRPGKSVHFSEIVWQILDYRSAGKIPLSEFQLLPSILRFRHYDSVEDGITIWEKWAPNLYKSAASRFLITGIRHVYFRSIFDIIIVANAVFIALDLDGGEQVFLTLFAIEILLKIYAFGFVAFIRKLWNLFDVIVVGAAIAVSLHSMIVGLTQRSSSALEILLVLRVLRIFKIFHSVPRFRVVLNTLLHILPSMATYGAVMGIISSARTSLPRSSSSWATTSSRTR